MMNMMKIKRKKSSADEAHHHEEDIHVNKPESLGDEQSSEPKFPSAWEKTINQVDKSQAEPVETESQQARKPHNKFSKFQKGE